MVQIQSWETALPFVSINQIRRDALEGVLTCFEKTLFLKNKVMNAS